jgi:hypothetical protein
MVRDEVRRELNAIINGVCFVTTHLCISKEPEPTESNLYSYSYSTGPRSQISVAQPRRRRYTRMIGRGTWMRCYRI